MTSCGKILKSAARYVMFANTMPCVLPNEDIMASNDRDKSWSAFAYRAHVWPCLKSEESDFPVCSIGSTTHPVSPNLFLEDCPVAAAAEQFAIDHHQTQTIKGCSECSNATNYLNRQSIEFGFEFDFLRIEGFRWCVGRGYCSYLQSRDWYVEGTGDCVFCGFVSQLVYEFTWKVRLDLYEPQLWAWKELGCNRCYGYALQSLDRWYLKPSYKFVHESHLVIQSNQRQRTTRKVCQVPRSRPETIKIEGNSKKQTEVVDKSYLSLHVSM